MKRLLTVSVLAVLTLVVFTPPSPGASCVCGQSCTCKANTCPGKCPVQLVGGQVPAQPKEPGPVVVTVEKTAAGDRLTWELPEFRSTYSAVVKDATEKTASDLVKGCYCAEGKCPLTAPKVRLVPKAAATPAPKKVD